MFASLVIALAAMGLAIGAWFRPVPNNKPPAAPTYTDEQVAAAKASMCAAFGKVDHALALADARDGGSDPYTQLTVANSTRQVLDAGSRYLSTKLAQEPATPPDVAEAVRRLANGYQELLIGYLNNLVNSVPEQQPALNASNEATLTMQRLCK